ncbi:MAG: hypothetical protein JNK94_03035 [Hyphomonadaceae bacterium]|nr:hypothetical protein [Hyphomonadaceae bacterium]
MFVILVAFTLFHIVVGTACLIWAVRLLTPGERGLWRAPAALLVAELMCWIYPIAAFVSAKLAWREHLAGAGHALPLLLAPILWLVVMGLVFAIADFIDDGVIGNARGRRP